MSFGKNLEQIRKSKRVSQTKLAGELGLTQQMISSYEKDVCSPNVEALIKIADYFNISIDCLVGRVINSPYENNPMARFFRYFETLNQKECNACTSVIHALLSSYGVDKEGPSFDLFLLC